MKAYYVCEDFVFRLDIKRYLKNYTSINSISDLYLFLGVDFDKQEITDDIWKEVSYLLVDYSTLSNKQLDDINNFINSLKKKYVFITNYKEKIGVCDSQVC